jgi:hypothetical protein
MVAKNPLTVGHFPKCMHMAAFAWFANVVTHELGFKKVLIWG